MNLSRSLFLDYLSTILPYGVEPDTIIDDPKSYPIKFLLNYTFHSGKYIYIGETSHTFHPVGGQGLNLCWRDVQSLSNLISSPWIKNKKIIIPFLYSISRFIDVLSISLLTDFLVRYSRSNINIFYLPRMFAFFVLKKSKHARKLLLNIMTNGFFN